MIDTIDDDAYAGFTDKGPFVQFRLKFDQHTLRKMVDWFGVNNTMIFTMPMRN